MIRRAVLPGLAALLLACGTGPSDVPTVLVQFDHPTTAADVASLEAIGGIVQARVDLVQLVVLRSSAPTERYRSVPGVMQVGRFVDESDPAVAVFIHVADRHPTEEEVAFVQGLGDPTAGATTDGLIVATLPVSNLAQLGTRPRFTTINLGFSKLYPFPR